ncbi:MAG: hypothetical protein ACOCZK_04525 [Planctomycetota bacterium]
MGLAQGLKHRAALVTLLATGVIGAVGLVFFLVALRPCSVDIAPGTIVTYELRREVQPVGAGGERGETRVHSQEITLACIGDANRVIVLSGADADRRGEVALMQLAEDGAAFLFDAAERRLDHGPCIGFSPRIRLFDFNLLRLPRSLTDSGEVEVTYAALPKGRRSVPCRIDRIENGMAPVFRLRPVRTIEWPHPALDGRYVKIRDLEARYRFDRRLGMVDRADVDFILAHEGDAEAPIKRYAIRLSLRLAEHDQVGNSEVASLGDLALTSVRAQSLLEDGRHASLGPYAERLRRATVDHPRLRRFVEQLLTDARMEQLRASHDRWAVRVASVGLARLAAARQVARELVADGYHAFLRRHGELVAIYVGPYTDKRPAVLAAMRERFARSDPYWVRLSSDS